MSDIVIVGDYSTVVFFKALGMDIIAVDRVKEGIKNISKYLRTKSYKIILVIEDYYKEIKEELEDTESIVVAIPSPKGVKGVGIQELKKIVEKAIGINIFRE